MNNKESNDDKVITAYYEHLGKKHYSNIIDEVDNLPDIDFDTSELDEWFDGFNKNIKKNIHRNQRSSRLVRILRKTGILVLALGLSFSIVISTVEAFRVSVFNFFMNEETEYTEIGHKNLDELQIEGLKNIHYFPQDFELVNYRDIGTIHSIEYLRENDDFIHFTQATKATKIQLDTEDTILEKFKVDDIEVIYVYKREVYSVYWGDTLNNYRIRSSLELDEIKKIIKSIK